MPRRTTRRRATPSRRTSVSRSRTTSRQSRNNPWFLSMVALLAFILLLYFLNVFSGGTKVPSQNLSNDSLQRPVNENSTLPAVKNLDK